MAGLQMVKHIAAGKLRSTARHVSKRIKNIMSREKCVRDCSWQCSPQEQKRSDPSGHQLLNRKMKHCIVACCIAMW